MRCFYEVWRHPRIWLGTRVESGQLPRLSRTSWKTLYCAVYTYTSCSQHTDAVSSSNLLDLVSANLNGVHVPITTSFFRCPLLPCFFFRNVCSKFVLLYFFFIGLMRKNTAIWVFLSLVSVVLKILFSKQLRFLTEKAWIFPLVS
jgi:hypothetical protein